MYKWSMFECDRDLDISHPISPSYCALSMTRKGVHRKGSNDFSYMKYFNGKFSFKRSKLKNDEDILIMKMYTLTLKDTSSSNSKITKMYIAQTYLLRNIGFSIWTSLKYNSIVVT